MGKSQGRKVEAGYEASLVVQVGGVILWTRVSTREAGKRRQVKRRKSLGLKLKRLGSEAGCSGVVPRCLARPLD